MNSSVFVAVLAAASIEVIEMVAIVVAVGVSRSWRASLLGAAGGLLVLLAVVAALGAALEDVPLQPLRLVVGALLLVFGLGWLRKGILQVSRDGWMAGGVGYEEIDEALPARDGRLDWTAFVLSFKGVTLEGLEVAIIVVAFGAAAGDLPAAALGAAAAVVVFGALGALTYRLVARIPRRTMQFFVGAMLTSFGTFWAAEGVGVHWPGGESSLLWLSALYLIAFLVALRLVRRWRAAGAQSLSGEHAPSSAQEPA